MVTLPHHVEFLSDAWLDEARKFLEREFERRGEQMRGQTFSVSERFTDAPPHLEFDANVAAWGMTFDGTHLHVGRNFDAEANIVVDGDYQAALVTAQTVGALAPGVMDAAFREMRHTFGNEALRVRGRLDSPVAQEVMALLHDHLARCTVENPDLEHRARRQGVAANIREVEEHGYTVLERAITPEFADELRAATLRALLPHHHFSLQWMLYHGNEFERIAQHPQLMTLIDASLGRGAVIASLSSIRRGPGKGARTVCPI